MKTRQFDVPEEIMYQFAEMLTENSVNGWIEGVKEDEEDREILIIAEFEKEQETLIDQLYEMIDNCYEEEEEEDDEEEEEEEKPLRRRK